MEGVSGDGEGGGEGEDGVRGRDYWAKALVAGFVWFGASGGWVIGKVRW